MRILGINCMNHDAAMAVVDVQGGGDILWAAHAERYSKVKNDHHLNQATCILMFKTNLSENARKRINILKNTNDGFKISEEDMKLRGFGDLLGFKQSGVKNFRLADPLHNDDLFILGEKEIRRIENEETNLSKYKPLLKLYDQADIINDLV